MDRSSKIVKIGDKFIGGCNPILIQSMTNIKTSKTDLVINQILELEKSGCDIIRVSVLDLDDAKAIKIIKENIHIPLVADIHFDYKLAIESIKSGCDKIRLNPGNIDNIDHVKEIVSLCKENNIPIRIGVNAGSLPKDLDISAESMIIAAKRHIDILESLDFHNIVLSLKSSDVLLSIKAYELAKKEFNYPLHIGITEAGLKDTGIVKNAIGIGVLLNEGIGDTIRVSLTSNPIDEILAAKEILSSLHLYDKPTLTCCPTCGRTNYDLFSLANKVNEYLKNITKPIKVAIMGCVVNGPGEAKNADIGVCGGNGEGLIIKQGKVIKKVSEDKLYDELIKEIETML